MGQVGRAWERGFVSFWHSHKVALRLRGTGGDLLIMEEAAFIAQATQSRLCLYSLDCVSRLAVDKISSWTDDFTQEVWEQVVIPLIVRARSLACSPVSTCRK